ncbi:hypothetical protein K461DRAFT_310074 [Myriangium duriaei CBS 260.36]|uniref:Uncharacterized protein n=1 Tax=Myriangium duriaei CBS 260.36 TaxID=1168546 RepID=A0A9P4JFM4_9PEZI|nr:hypothetical protein K461DRAFT_310074 [Myriangium duriaei CBS 260.36]
MVRISYTVAKAVLSEVEKNRLLACYLAIENPNEAVDFNLAAQEFGSASTESFKKMIQTSWKKVEQSVTDGTAVEAVGKQLATPKKRQTRKRKVEENDDGSAIPAVPKKPAAKRGRAKKVKEEKVVSEDDAIAENTSSPAAGGSMSPTSGGASSPAVGSDETMEEGTTVNPGFAAIKAEE